MDLGIAFFSSVSIVVPAMMAAIRFWRINAGYYPFLFLIWIGLFNEILSLFVTTRNNAPNSNLYLLLEGILILIFFRQAKQTSLRGQHYIFLLLLFLIWWVAEVVIVGLSKRFVSYFIIMHSLIIVFLSIDAINFLVGNKNLRRDPLFLIWTCFIIYFTYAILVELVWMNSSFFSRDFKRNVQTILSFVNIATNLIFALAILWMPKKKISSLSFS